MCAHHVKFVARTVLVRNNDVEAAYRALDRLIVLLFCSLLFLSQISSVRLIQLRLVLSAVCLIYAGTDAGTV